MCVCARAALDNGFKPSDILVVALNGDRRVWMKQRTRSVSGGRTMPLLNTGPDRLDLTLTLSISIVGAWGGGGGGGEGGCNICDSTSLSGVDSPTQCGSSVARLQ